MEFGVLFLYINLGALKMEGVELGYTLYPQWRVSVKMRREMGEGKNQKRGPGLGWGLASKGLAHCLPAIWQPLGRGLLMNEWMYESWVNLDRQVGLAPDLFSLSWESWINSSCSLNCQATLSKFLSISSISIYFPLGCWTNKCFTNYLFFRRIGPLYLTFS